MDTRIDRQKSKARDDRNDGDDGPHSLEELLERLSETTQKKNRISIGSMLEAVGRRSFGPLILTLGLIAFSPLSGIPTIPSLVGIMVALIAGQLLFGRKYFWLPRKLLDQSIDQKKFIKSLNAIQPIGRFVDRLIKPRFTFVTGRIGTFMSAAFCMVIGLTMPPLEIVPFLATTSGAALTVFGLSLIARDGLLALIAFLISGVAFYLAVRYILF